MMCTSGTHSLDFLGLNGGISANLPNSIFCGTVGVIGGVGFGEMLLEIDTVLSSDKNNLVVETAEGDLGGGCKIVEGRSILSSSSVDIDFTENLKNFK